MSKIFSLSEAASIAIHSMVLIARNEGSMNVVNIASQTGASKNHISKVLQRLVKSGFLRSVRGPSGGFFLKLPGDQISLLDIYEIIEGKVEISKCPMDYQICPFDKCFIDNIIHEMTEGFTKFLKEHTLSDYIQK
ncbi:MAG: Rrf2 family transcriptional regulator [Bacteroidetes bacterium]|nr:Rrf2 family transcriptional regulator [Bacteroidota bacterium]